MKVIACTRDGFAHGLLAFGKPPERGFERGIVKRLKYWQKLR